MLRVVDDPAVRPLLEQVLQEHHPDLVEVGVTFALLFAFPKEGATGPPLKLHGYPCLATVKVNSVKARLEGAPDCTITLSEPDWVGHPEGRKRAILDHECTHVVVCRDGEGAPKYDEAGRPKLGTRLHDAQWGGFFEVARRHGPAAVETEAYRDLHRAMVQRELFPAE